jgi:hypothetical protein
MKLLVVLVLVSTAIAAGPKFALSANDIVGTWVSLQQCPGESTERFTVTGKYEGWCYDMVDIGRWTLRDGDKIMITHYDDAIKETTSAKSRRETITILGWEPHSDRTFMYVRLADGRRDKWMK